MPDENTEKFPVNPEDIEKLAWQALKDKRHLERERSERRAGGLKTACLFVHNGFFFAPERVVFFL